ncbi:MAG: T9SS type A sorting domain-containing protein [Bacteroidia bacterium]
MKKTALLIILLSTTFVGKGQWYVPQFQAGVYVHDTSFFTHAPSLGLCGSFAEYTLCLDTNLIPFVTGVYSELIITTLSNPGTVYTNQTGIINLHDSLIFTATNHCFSFHYTAPCTLEFVFVIAGTPTVPFESYSCSLQDSFYIVPIGQCDLIHVNLFASQTICSVNNFTGIEEQNTNAEIKIYPNPVGDELKIKVSDKIKELKIFDATGRIVLEQRNLKTKIVNLKSFQNGIYFIEINDGKNSWRKKFMKE